MSLSLNAVAAALVATALAGCGNTYVIDAAGNGGRVVDLDQDLVLPPDGNFELVGSPSARCLLRGDGHSLRAADGWSGRITIRWCDIVGLGTAQLAGINLVMHGAASATIEDSIFDASGQVHFLNYDASTVTFSRNVILATSLVPAFARITESQPVFSAQVQESTGSKLFQGNRILHGDCHFRGSNWKVGGDGPEGNLFVGPRAGLLLEGPGILVRGNYVHTIFPTEPPALPNGQELAPVTVLGDWPDLTIEHNVLRHGFWVIRGLSGELRYNAIVDADASDWVRDPRPGSKMHHNVFVNYAVPGEETRNVPPSPTVQGGIEIVGSVTSGVEIWANTFDGGGATKYFGGSTIAVEAGSSVDSVRSNIFMRFAHRSGSASVGPGAGEPIEPTPPDRLGYADYNLFFNPQAELQDHYGVAVANRVEVQDAGFGANDPPRGARDADVDPQLAGPFVDRFPWTDDAILSGEIGVPSMLAYFQGVYAPRAASPAIDAGDLRDGPGADIGAIGSGEPNTNDRFAGLGGSPPAVSVASARASDGPLVLRCSARALGPRGSARWVLGAWLALTGLCLARRRARLQLLPPFAKARAAPVQPHPHRR